MLAVFIVVLFLSFQIWPSATYSSFDGYVFWEGYDFSSALAGNTDGVLITTSITDAISSCNSQGTGCVAVSYLSATSARLKTAISYPDADNTILGVYIKAVSDYVILPGIDIHPGGDIFSTSKNNVACTSYCTSLGSTCIGVGMSALTGLCYGKDSYSPGSNKDQLSFIEVSQNILRCCIYILLILQTYC